MTDSTREPGAGQPTGPDLPDAAPPSYPPPPPQAWMPDAAPPGTAEPTIEVAPVTAVAHRPGGLRWGIALGLVAALIAVTAAAAFLLVGSGSPSKVAGWAPAGSVIYAEGRLDLPGDQRRLLGEFLSHFPGFDDQAAMETKLAEALDQLVRGASDGRYNWKTDIEPWFDGELAIVLRDLPSLLGGGFDGSGEFTEPEPPQAIVLASVKDVALAEAWLDGADGSTRTETYAGATLRLSGEGSTSTAWTIVEDVLVVGETRTVKAAIDTGGRTGMASQADVKAARAALAGDHVGFLFIDMQAYGGYLQDMLGAFGAAETGCPNLAATLADQPAWLGEAIRIEGDAIRLEGVMPVTPSTADAPAPSASELTAHLPASTIAFVEARGGGVLADQLVEQYRRYGCGDEIDEVLKMLDVVGGFDSMTDWIGDVGVVVTADGTDVSAAILVAPTEPTGATRLLNQAKAFLALSPSATGLEVREETYAGTTITIFEAPGLIGGDVMPIDPKYASLAVAVRDDLVVIGVGTAAVKAVLDAGPGSSLADEARYGGLLDRIGRDGTSGGFIDLKAIRELFESMGAAGAAGLPSYERDVKPYLEPFDALVFNATVDGTTSRTTIFVTVD